LYFSNIYYQSSLFVSPSTPHLFHHHLILLLVVVLLLQFPGRISAYI